MRSRVLTSLLLTALVGLTVPVSAEPVAPDSPEAKAHNDAAKALASVGGPVLEFPFHRFCETGYRFPTANDKIDQQARPKDLFTPLGYILRDEMARPQEPTQVFDNLYYMGYTIIGSFVVKTDQGLIIIDTLNNSEDVDKFILPAFKKFGLNIADLKYIVLTHQHGDHYGGINRLLELVPTAKVVAGKPDADELDARRNKPLPANASDREKAQHALIPKRFDIRVAAFPGSPNGVQDLTLGNTTIKMALVPSHTIGMLSLILPVYDHGTRHIAAMWGGNHIDNPNAYEKSRQYTASLDFFHSITTLAGVDVDLHPHAYQSDEFRLMDEMNANPGMKNPFVIGTDNYDRYLSIWTECFRALGIRTKDGTWKRF